MSLKSTSQPLRTILLARSLPLLASRVWDHSLTSQIEQASLPNLVKAGLHLWNDDLERCHGLAQAGSSLGENYWHALMHRREGDFENSLYWYRRVNGHPVLQQMQRFAPGWSPDAFNKRCADASEQTLPELESLQAKEMSFLLDWSENSAT